jgi:protein arginine kinase activator
MKCDRCNKIAVHHLTEVSAGKTVEKHLCENCMALEGGTAVKTPPINELLTNFVLAHSGGAKETSASCPECGITWGEFRQSSLLGCEHDYPLFDKELTPLLQRAHENGTHHIGKVPARRSGTAVPAKKQADLTRLRKELARAVEAEDYERAAKLRDQIREAEGAG